MQVAWCSHWDCMTRLQTSFWQKIGDESQAVVVRMQELRRIYRPEIITRCTLHFTYRWWLRCTNCAGCIRDASQVVFKMHKLWGMYLRCITRPEWDWEALKVVTSDGGLLTRLWIEIKKLKPTFCLTFFVTFSLSVWLPPSHCKLMPPEKALVVFLVGITSVKSSHPNAVLWRNND